MIDLERNRQVQGTPQAFGSRENILNIQRLCVRQTTSSPPHSPSRAASSLLCPFKSSPPNVSAVVGYGVNGKRNKMRSDEACVKRCTFSLPARTHIATMVDLPAIRLASPVA